MCKVANDTNDKLNYLKWILNSYVQLKQEWITSPTTSKFGIIQTPYGEKELSKEEIEIVFSIVTTIHEGVEQLISQVNRKQLENGLSPTLNNSIQEDNSILEK